MSAYRQILEAVQHGRLSVEDGLTQLREFNTDDLTFARVDRHREARTGTAEVIYGEGKTAEQMVAIMQSLEAGGARTILATRVSAAQAAAVVMTLPAVIYEPRARLLWWHRRPPAAVGKMAVLCAGTTDLFVAEEAYYAAKALGNRVDLVADVGVSGLHRLVEQVERLRNARVLIVVAGMEGALPSVVAGLVSMPIIAVPTSVGYGANLGGVAALLAMLNACALGVSVVNIDNGIGAAYQASTINHQAQFATRTRQLYKWHGSRQKSSSMSSTLPGNGEG